MCFFAIILTDGITLWAQRSAFISLDLASAIKRSDLSLSCEIIRPSRTAYEITLIYVDSRLDILKEQSSDGFLRYSEFYDSYFLDLQIRMKALRKNFIYRGKSIQLGVGLFSRIRLATEDRYLVEFEEQYGNNPWANPDVTSGLDHFGGLAFVGYKFRVFNAFWFETDLSYRLISYHDFSWDRDLRVRISIKYMLGWKKYKTPVRLSKAPLLILF